MRAAAAGLRGLATRTTLAAKNGRGGVLIRFAISDDLAKGDGMALRYEPVQIILGAMDRHGANGMLRPSCLPHFARTIPNASAAISASSKNNS
jgi:hypothetical protein